LLTVILAAGPIVLLQPSQVLASEKSLLEQLSAEQKRVYLDWRRLRDQFERRHDGYWQRIDLLKAQRRRKARAGQAITSSDYASQHPPRYDGPPLRADIAKLMAKTTPPQASSSITSLSEMMSAAKRIYGFTPLIAQEREFKRRYAAEALDIGLTKEQVVKVYALETGGRGTFDMQAGIHPIKRTGEPISTALGYAQLLAANTIDVISRSGDGFVDRLNMLAARPGTPRGRTEGLITKVRSLKRMIRAARSVPRQWSHHVAMSRTPAGFAMHALNLDADIGPWLQVIKLAGLREMAEKAGRNNLAGAEIELMNLAGPATGLQMMTPAARKASTANFFSRRGYYRNTIVRWKTAPELLAALDERMSENLKRPGSIEFAGVFDEVSAGRGGGAAQASAAPPVAPARLSPTPLRPSAPLAPMRSFSPPRRLDRAAPSPIGFPDQM
jgi:hypothetical protein